MSHQPRPRIKPEMVAAIGTLLAGVAAVAGLLIQNARDNSNAAPATTTAPGPAATAPPGTSGPGTSPTTQDASGYQLVYRNRPFILSAGGCGGSAPNAANFDAPTVFYGAGGENDLDIMIGNCADSLTSFNLSVGELAAMSLAPDATRSPADCATAVETQPTTELHKPRLPLTLCLRTSDGAIALVHLLRFRDELDSQPLSITASLWTKP